MKRKITSLNDIERKESYNDFTSGNYQSYGLLPSPNKVTKTITFENKQITKVIYEVPFVEVISDLLKEIRNLRERLNILEKDGSLGKGNVMIVQDSLKEIWNNNKDDIWDSI